jgi:hypothetical protein
MLNAVKAPDLQRDSRCAIHAHPSEKIAGIAIEVTDIEQKRASRPAMSRLGYDIGCLPIDESRR